MNNTHISTNDHHVINQLFEKATSSVGEARNSVRRSINSEMAPKFLNQHKPLNNEKKVILKLIFQHYCPRLL